MNPVVSWLPSQEQIDADEARIQRECAEAKAEHQKRLDKFLGTIVRVESDEGEVLVYADGRKLRLIGEWYEWE